jgi:hypothetical protein
MGKWSIQGLPVSLPLRSPPLGTPECKDNLKKHFDYEAQAARDFCSVQGVPVSLLLRSPLPLGMPECKDNVRNHNDCEAQAAMTMMMKVVVMIYGNDDGEGYETMLIIMIMTVAMVMMMRVITVMMVMMMVTMMMAMVRTMR